MSKRTKIIAGVVIVLCGVCLLLANDLRKGERQLRAATIKADRIVVNLDVYPPRWQAARNAPSLPSFEVVGADKVAQFFDAVDLKISLLPWHCKCYGNMLFEFYEGDRLLAAVSYHYGESLNWRDGEWSGHRKLTDRGKEALESWLQANGCPTTEQAEAIVEAAWEEQAAKQDDP